VDVDIINSFITATQQVLSKQLRIPFVKGVLEVKSENAGNELLTCVTGLSGTIGGCVALSLPKEMASRLFDKINSNSNEKDVIETKASMINLIKITCRISDIARESINSKDIIIEAPQMVSQGKKTPFPLGMPVISISFKTHSGVFYIESAYVNHIEEDSLINERI
jgi:chemotaxis protein CheX